MPNLKTQTEALLSKKQKALELGGVQEIEKQHTAKKLTVRERLDLLFDPQSFVELGILAQSQSSAKEKPTPADGCVTGYGKVNGRMCCVIAYDFTVMAGSLGVVGERKAKKIRELALKDRIPIIWLLDSA